MLSPIYYVMRWRRAVDLAVREGRLTEKDLMRCQRLTDVAMAKTGELRSATGGPYTYRQLSHVMDVAPDTGRTYLADLQARGLLRVQQPKHETEPDRRWLAIPDGWEAPSGYQFKPPAYHRAIRQAVRGVHRPETASPVHEDAELVHRKAVDRAPELGPPVHRIATDEQRISVERSLLIGDSVGVSLTAPSDVLVESSHSPAAHERRQLGAIQRPPLPPKPRKPRGRSRTPEEVAELMRWHAQKRAQRPGYGERMRAAVAAYWTEERRAEARERASRGREQEAAQDDADFAQALEGKV